jgi:hypothetical protein
MQLNHTGELPIFHGIGKFSSRFFAAWFSFNQHMDGKPFHFKKADI